ncbi:diguanylate cyclase (GGDEF) domain-containing protein [Actinopolyspora saharensis]|uniref:Diguanylate cyclase (GGDEF) domain-containing protein n=1 Tax=Actinopolyspora saharensis TaxID=995062 RepID=A0A1H0ZA37_9ACTN|nr:diguanylate cyclase (GGDEF) domain-containing protein [Actinopolyspora saharensis]
MVPRRPRRADAAAEDAFREDAVRNVLPTAVTAVVLGCWIADRVRNERALARERRSRRLALAGQRERHRRELDELERRHRSDIAEALTDPVTGLANRRAWEPTVSARLRAPCELALLDLDDFKRINDTHGHAAGDQLLNIVARRLRRALGPDAALGRVGGDEIVMAVRPGVDWARVAAVVTADVGITETTAVRVGASIGVFRTDGQPAPGLAHALRSADTAMYRAKRLGVDWQPAAGSHSEVAMLPRAA